MPPTQSSRPAHPLGFGGGPRITEPKPDQQGVIIVKEERPNLAAEPLYSKPEQTPEERAKEARMALYGIETPLRDDIAKIIYEALTHFVGTAIQKEERSRIANDLSERIETIGLEQTDLYGNKTGNYLVRPEDQPANITDELLKGIDWVSYGIHEALKQQIITRIQTGLASRTPDTRHTH